MHINFLGLGLVHKEEEKVYNVAAIVRNVRPINAYHEIFLPSYSVLDERRYFDPRSVNSMNPEIVVVDYGMGNLGSVERALRKVGCDVKVTHSPSLIRKARGLVLPGVGSFRDCMVNLEKYGLIEPVKRFIFSGRPFLGICLGMQILFAESEEFGHTPGFNILRGKVVHFPKVPGLKIPHMGWNRITIKKSAPLLKGIPDGSYVYFVHSYYIIPEDESVIATTTEYGIEFASSIWKDNIFACQFHPEKSQNIGLNILRRFKEVATDAGQENNPLS